jgi:phenylpyruvate tautomerase PptA (4-oxalocrotonate tautomerase family)
MPTLSISSNVDIQDADALAVQASKLVAEMLGKPEMYVMVLVKPNCTLYFGGTNDPAALLSLHSLGLPGAQIKSYSEKLCSFINQHLKIPEDRVYINFESPERSHWGWNSTTFG